MTRMRSAGIAIIGLISLMIVFVFVAYVQLILVLREKSVGESLHAQIVGNHA